MATRWNLLVYGIVSDAQEHAAMQAALLDMRVALTTNDCKVGVQLITATGTTRSWITLQDKTASTVMPGTVNASSAASLTAFLDAAEQRLGAAPTALVVYAHGSGLDDVHKYMTLHGRWPTARPATWPVHLPLKLPRPYRLGPDPKTQAFLSNVGLRDAIANSTSKTVDVLALNACWMAMFEIEHELRKVCAVAVASQVFAQTWAYGDLVAQLCAHPPASAVELGSLLVARVADQISAGKRGDAVSACRTDKLAALENAFDAFATAVTPLVTSDWAAVENAIVNVVQRVDDPLQVDMRSLLSKLGKGHSAVDKAAKTARALLDEVVIANAAATGHPGARGLSVLCPRVDDVDIAAAYQGLDFATNAWSTFLVDFQQRLAQ